MKFRIIILWLFFSIFATAQTGMQMENNRKKISIPFKLINNLIFIPITVNGVELNFLLDTGSAETVLFGLEEADAITFQNVEKIKLRGYGSNEFIDGLKSTNNQLFINGFFDNNHTVYIVLNQDFNLSSQVGIPVNGIIGSHFFENCLIETNYQKQKIYIYKESAKVRKKLTEKYTESEITIENNKPYFVPKINLNNKEFMSKLLIDSGSSDALWLFKNKNNLVIPTKNIDDFLGKGFSGPVYGKRARIDKIFIDKFEFLQPLVAFPDITDLKKDAEIYDNEGSIGGEILKRFSIFYDYPNDKIYFKKNASFYLPFNYNMSGIELQHDGLQWVKETDSLNKTAVNSIKFDLSSEKTVNFQYKFSLKPIFKIYNIRKNSPAEKCGLQKDDIVISINNTLLFNYTIQEINELLKSEEGRNIKIEIERNGIKMEFKFRLEVLI